MGSERMGALLNLGKYVRRGSPWEARRQLEEARALLFQLWAHAEDVAQARYGITALFDLEAPRLPAGIERTLAGRHLAELVAAGRALGELLEATQERLAVAGTTLPDELASFVLGDLAQLEGAGRSLSTRAASRSTPGG